MVRKKVEPLVDDEEQPTTRQVKVNSVTRREYVEEEPIIETDSEELDYLDPFSAFNEIVTTNQQATLRIWRLPNYDMDGRTAISGTDREYCGSINYNAGNAALLDQIHARVPMGGMLSLELFAEGAIRKRGLLKLVKPIGSPQTQLPGYPPITINQPNPQQAATTKPFEGVKEAFTLLREMGETMKAVMPVAPASVGSIEPTEQPSIKDRILEGVIVKAFEGDKVPGDRFDRVLDVLAGGRNEPGITETIVQGIAPHLGGFLQGISSGLNALLMRLATGTPVEASSSPVAASSSGVLTEGQAEPQAPADPAEWAWRRVLGRLLDDLFEHVNCIKEARAPIDVHSSAEAIVDLAARFEANEQIAATITSLLSLPPDQVIDLCVMMVPLPMQQRVSELKSNQAAITWLVELQNETKGILADSQGEPANEDKERNRE